MGVACPGRGCQGRLVQEYPDKALYDQLKFYETLFDVDRAQTKVPTHGRSFELGIFLFPHEFRCEVESVRRRPPPSHRPLWCGRLTDFLAPSSSPLRPMLACDVSRCWCAARLRLRNLNFPSSLLPLTLTHRCPSCSTSRCRSLPSPPSTGRSFPWWAGASRTTCRAAATTGSAPAYGRRYSRRTRCLAPSRPRDIVFGFVLKKKDKKTRQYD